MNVLDMNTKMRTNKRTGEQKLFTEVAPNEWVPTEEYLREQEAESTSTGSAVAMGAGKNTDDLIQNTKALISGGPGKTEDPGYAALQEEHPIATTAGEIGSEIAQIALPGGAVARGAAKVAPKLVAGSPVMASTLADVLASAGTGYARQGGSAEERAANAGNEAAWAFGGGLLNKIMSGAKVTDDAAKLIDEGVYLTPGQSAKNPSIRALEAVMEYTPFTATPTKAAREYGETSWRNTALNRVGKAMGVDVSKIKDPQEAFTMINDAVSGGYKKVFQGVDSIPKLGFDSVLKKLGKIRLENPSDTAALQRVGKEFRKYRKFKEGNRGDLSKQADRLDYWLRQQIEKAPGGPLQEALLDIKRTYHNSFGPEVKGQLAKLDGIFPDKLTLQKATGNATTSPGGFVPNELAGASKSVGGELAAATAKSPLQDIARAGQETVARDLGPAPLEFLRRLSGGIQIPLIPESVIESGSRIAGNAVTGQTAAHKAGRKMPGPLRDLARPSAIVPAMKDEEEDDLLTVLRSLMGN